MRNGFQKNEANHKASGFLLPADVIAEIYGVLQASAKHFESAGAQTSAEHARYLAFQLLNATYI